MAPSLSYHLTKAPRLHYNVHHTIPAYETRILLLIMPPSLAASVVPARRDVCTLPAHDQKIRDSHLHAHKSRVRLSTVCDTSASRRGKRPAHPLHHVFLNVITNGLTIGFSQIRVAKLYVRALVLKEVEPRAPHPRLFVLSLEKPRADDLSGSSFTGLARFGA